jgi:hypothetical protein
MDLFFLDTLVRFNLICFLNTATIYKTRNKYISTYCIHNCCVTSMYVNISIDEIDK